MADATLGMSATGEGYERLRRALEGVEAGVDPGALQRSTKALGLYQFMPFWQSWIQKETGRTALSFLPKDDSPQELARAAKDQREVLFPKYYEKEMAPWLAAARKNGLGKGRSDLELAVIFHKLGSTSANEYLRTGFDASRGTKDNEPIEDYVRKVASRAASSASLTDAAPQIGKWHRNQSTAALPFSRAPTPRHDQRDPVQRATVAVSMGAKQAMPGAAAMFSATPDAAVNENQRVLAGLNELRAKLGAGLLTDEYEQRLIAESRGVV